MTWIKTVAMSEASERLKRAIEEQAKLYPSEYDTPIDPSREGPSEIVAAHSLIPDALFHAFAAYGTLLDPDLPLERRQHEMIATVVSATNRCAY